MTYEETRDWSRAPPAREDRDKVSPHFRPAARPRGLRPRSRHAGADRRRAGRGGGRRGRLDDGRRRGAGRDRRRRRRRGRGHRHDTAILVERRGPLLGPMKLLFERSEYLDRIGRTKQAMAERGIDLLLVASPANQFWLTGYDGWSFYTPQIVALRLDQEEPIWVGRKMDAVGAKFTAFLKRESVVPYPDIYVASAERHPLQFVAEEITRRGWGRGTVGVESDDYYYTAKWDATLRAGLPNARFVDAFLLVNRCRMKKSAAELAFMRQAGRIAALAQKAAFDKAEPGVRQCDVMAELYKVTTAGTPEFGGTFPCKPPNAMVGEMCSAPHLSWTDEKLEANDLFYIEMGGVRHRYHSPLSRCIYLGKPTGRMDTVANVIAHTLPALPARLKPA